MIEKKDASRPTACDQHFTLADPLWTGPDGRSPEKQGLVKAVAERRRQVLRHPIGSREVASYDENNRNGKLSVVFAGMASGELDGRSCGNAELVFDQIRGI